MGSTWGTDSLVDATFLELTFVWKSQSTSHSFIRRCHRLIIEKETQTHFLSNYCSSFHFCQLSRNKQWTRQNSILWLWMKAANLWDRFSWSRGFAPSGFFWREALVAFLLFCCSLSSCLAAWSYCFYFCPGANYSKLEYWCSRLLLDPHQNLISGVILVGLQISLRPMISCLASRLFGGIPIFHYFAFFVLWYCLGWYYQFYFIIL